ncbi:hypothetical protein DAETH_16130 [Deinococcus aetherius]|uniref:Uncharacterized protein n=1 Tax=Deinococcus aetherius TaxID=200252 RepID=A0ABN6RFI6_9DEIO|nr:ChpI protein [Deinococcus aetherius]BDP41644.1 hypothetical protein DAETH_16130 [Deinococcus aetherius]
MKTAISVSDTPYERGERYAWRRFLSKGELYACVLGEYLDRHENDDMTVQLGELHAEEDSRLEVAPVELGFEVRRRQERQD